MDTSTLIETAFFNALAPKVNEGIVINRVDLEHHDSVAYLVILFNNSIYEMFITFSLNEYENTRLSVLVNKINLMCEELQLFYNALTKTFPQFKFTIKRGCEVGSIAFHYYFNNVNHQIIYYYDKESFSQSYEFYCDEIDDFKPLNDMNELFSFVSNYHKL